MAYAARFIPIDHGTRPLLPPDLRGCVPDHAGVTSPTRRSATSSTLLFLFSSRDANLTVNGLEPGLIGGTALPAVRMDPGLLSRWIRSILRDDPSLRRFSMSQGRAGCKGGERLARSDQSLKELGAIDNGHYWFWLLSVRSHSAYTDYSSENYYEKLEPAGGIKLRGRVTMASGRGASGGR
jgi:hypothetical protein